MTCMLELTASWVGGRPNIYARHLPTLHIVCPSHRNKQSLQTIKTSQSGPCVCVSKCHGIPLILVPATKIFDEICTVRLLQHCKPEKQSVGRLASVWVAGNCHVSFNLCSKCWTKWLDVDRVSRFLHHNDSGHRF